jgi:hypothetical protein
MITCLFPDNERQHFRGEAEATIRDACTEAEPEIRRLLPGLPESIELHARIGKRVLAETGELGSAATPNCVTWVVDSGRPGGVAAIAGSQLRATLFHEFHHLARGWVKSGGPRWPRMIDAVVCEGLATAFERDFGGRRAPWADYPQNASSWVEELLTLPADAPYHHWMFRHPDGRAWLGYKAGVFIADRASSATGRTAADLVATPTDAILEMAGWPP